MAAFDTGFERAPRFLAAHVRPRGGKRCYINLARILVSGSGVPQQSLPAPLLWSDPVEPRTIFVSWVFPTVLQGRVGVHTVVDIPFIVGRVFAGGGRTNKSTGFIRLNSPQVEGSRTGE